MRARSSALNDSWKTSAACRIRLRARPGSSSLALAPLSLCAFATPPSPWKTARSMPAVKCLPVDDSTIARASPSSESRFTISGSSRQKAGVIELSACGRQSRSWAT